MPADSRDPSSRCACACWICPPASRVAIAPSCSATRARTSSSSSRPAVTRLRTRSAAGAPVDPLAGSPLFQYLHAGHRSAVADLTIAAGQEHARRVAATSATRAGILRAGRDRIARPRAGRAARSQSGDVTAVDLRVRPRRPWSNRAATEFTLQAWCGSLASRGIPGSAPVGVGGAAWAPTLRVRLRQRRVRWRSARPGEAAAANTSTSRRSRR